MPNAYRLGQRAEWEASGIGCVPSPTDSSRACGDFKDWQEADSSLKPCPGALSLPRSFPAENSCSPLGHANDEQTIPHSGPGLVS